MHGQFDDCNNSSDKVIAPATGNATSPDNLGGFGKRSRASGFHHGDVRRLAVPVWVVVVLVTVLPLTIAVAVVICCCYCKDCPLYKVGNCSPDYATKDQLQVSAVAAGITQMYHSKRSMIAGFLNSVVSPLTHSSSCRSPLTQTADDYACRLCMPASRLMQPAQYLIEGAAILYLSNRTVQSWLPGFRNKINFAGVFNCGGVGAQRKQRMPVLMRWDVGSNPLPSASSVVAGTIEPGIALCRSTSQTCKAKSSCSYSWYSMARTSCSDSSNSTAKSSCSDSSNYGAAPCSFVHSISPQRPLHGTSKREFQLPQVPLANSSTGSGRLPSYLRRVPEDDDVPLPEV